MSSPSDTQQLESLFGWFNEVGIIAQLSGNAFEQVLSDDLNRAQFSVLNWFCRVDTEATPGRLARAFQVTPGAMTNTLQRLSAKGYVRIEQDPDSGRRKRVTLTDAGAHARQRALAALAPLLAEFAAGVEIASLQAQLPVLRQVREYLDARREQDA